MWETIITTLLIVLKFFIGRKSDDKEMQKLFYDFVNKFNKEYLNSVKLKKSYEKQLAKLKEDEKKAK